MKRFVRILPVLVAVILMQAGVEKKGSFDITEYADEQAPTQEVYKKGSFDLTMTASGGTDKGGDVPVVTG